MPSDFVVSRSGSCLKAFGVGDGKFTDRRGGGEVHADAFLLGRALKILFPTHKKTASSFMKDTQTMLRRILFR